MVKPSAHPVAGIKLADRSQDDLHDDGLEVQFRKEHPVLWAVTLLGPLALTVSVLLTIGVVAGWDYLHKLVVMAVASLWLFGRFIILGGADPDVATATSNMSCGELFAMVVYLDVAIAIILAFHLGFLFRVPWLGPKIQLLVIDGRFILEKQP
jgi:hypothetical protein